MITLTLKIKQPTQIHGGFGIYPNQVTALNIIYSLLPKLEVELPDQITYVCDFIAKILHEQICVTEPTMNLRMTNSWHRHTQMSNLIHSSAQPPWCTPPYDLSLEWKNSNLVLTLNFITLSEGATLFLEEDQIPNDSISLIYDSLNIFGVTPDKLFDDIFLTYISPLLADATQHFIQKHSNQNIPINPIL